MESCELEHDQVILVCGSVEEPSVWDEFCVSRADRVLAVVAGPAPKEEPDSGGSRSWASGLRGADLVGYGITARLG